MIVADPTKKQYASPGRARQASILRGTKQTPEHLAKRLMSIAKTLEATMRNCMECRNSFQPTGCAQRYCSGQCWERKARRKRVERLKRQRQPKLHATLYAELLAKQNGVCAICARAYGDARGSRFAVDHDHKTGSIRGLLCHRCNTAIGLLNDDYEILCRASSYLERTHNST